MATIDKRRRSDDYLYAIDLVRNLKGAAASILLVLHLTGQPHSPGELRAAVGYSDKPVRQALRYLSLRSLIQEDRGCWRLTADTHALLGNTPSPPAAPRDQDNGDEGLKGHFSLPAVLKRAGVQPPAYDRLVARDELLAEPARTLGWWWHLLTQRWVRNRAGMLIHHLEEGNRPPGPYFTLARLWPQIPAEIRQDMRRHQWRAWQPGQYARQYADRYPEFTAEVFAAFLAVYQVARDELGYRD